MKGNLFLNLWLLIFFILSISSAQWKWINPVPHGKEIFDVHFFDNINGIAVGERGNCITTSDGGNTWKIIPPSTSFDITQSIFLNRDIGYAIGQKWEPSSLQSVLLKTTDGGYYWEIIPNIENYNVLDFSLIDNAIFVSVALGNFGYQILKTTDDGYTWDVVTELEGNPQRALFVLNDTTALKVNTTNESNTNCYIFKTTDGGISWKNKFSLGRRSLSKFRKIGDNLLIGIGSQGTIVLSHDYGDTWTDVSVSTVANFYQIAEYGSNVALILGNDNRGKTEVYRSTDQGFNWSRIFFSDYKYNDIAIKPNGEYWIGGHGGYILCSVNKGKSWTLKNGIFRSDISSIYFVEPGLGWVVGAYGFVAVTFDGGRTWTRRRVPTTENLKQVVFYNDKIGWIIGSMGNVFKTQDRGRSWIKQHSVFPRVLHSICVLTENIVIATGDSSLVILSRDGGRTWNQIHNGSVMDDRFAHLSISRSNAVFLALGTQLFKSFDTCKSWVRLTSLGNDFFDYSITAINFPTPHTGYVFVNSQVFGNSFYYKTINGGVSWVLHSLDYSRWVGTVKDVFFISDSIGWVIGDQLFFTTNGGGTWIRDDDIRGNTIQMFTMDKGWIAGNGGIIIRTDEYFDLNNGNRYPEEFYLYQNFPNPFNTSTVIGYELYDKVHVKINIYDILGRKVAVLVDRIQPSGIYEVKWDAYNFASGVYVYQLQAGDYTAVKKMVLIR